MFFSYQWICSVVPMLLWQAAKLDRQLPFFQVAIFFLTLHFFCSLSHVMRNALAKSRRSV